MLVPRHHDKGQQPVGLVESPGDEERHDRHLGDVELEVAHHALERGGHAALEFRELEAVGAGAELLRHRVIADQGFQACAHGNPLRTCAR
jgi:hypothetical protein